MIDLFADVPLLDEEVERVDAAWRQADPDNERASRVLRETFDQLYDGLRTGRFRWEQLFKTEKTHFGTLIEINLRREFNDLIDDGARLDFKIAGIEVDCKYSQRMGGWMIPPEGVNQVLLVMTADDVLGRWSLGLIRATADILNGGSNRDQKKTLSMEGRGRIAWLAQSEPLPPNALIGLDESVIERIFGAGSGQKRVNELLRSVLNRRIGRNTIATVAQQSDYMKRVRANGGARSQLAPEGILVLGDYREHRQMAAALGAVVPEKGETVSVQVVSASQPAIGVVEIQGRLWRLAALGESPNEAAPILPGAGPAMPG